MWDGRTRHRNQTALENVTAPSCSRAQVNFEAHVAPLADEENFDEIAPMQGRYKTSDAVSYEDLMEFALDA